MAARDKLVLGEDMVEALQRDEQFDFIVVEVDLVGCSALSLHTCNSSSDSLASTDTIGQFVNI